MKIFLISSWITMENLVVSHTACTYMWQVPKNLGTLGTRPLGFGVADRPPLPYVPPHVCYCAKFGHSRLSQTVPGRERSLTISSAVWIQCTKRDRRTDTRRQQRTSLRIASRGKKKTRTMFLTECQKKCDDYVLSFRHSRPIKTLVSRTEVIKQYRTGHADSR